MYFGPAYSEKDTLHKMIVNKIENRFSTIRSQDENYAGRIKSSSDLVQNIFSSANISAIKQGLDSSGYHGNPRSKLVKKALQDVIDAIVNASKYTDAARRDQMVRSRIRSWCRKIDPLKAEKAIAPRGGLMLG